MSFRFNVLIADYIFSVDVFHFHADDTVVWSSSSSAVQTLELLQAAFDHIQSHLTQLKLALNAFKSKCMLFRNGKEVPSNLPKISAAQGVEIEIVTTYICVGIIMIRTSFFRGWNLNKESFLGIKAFSPSLPPPIKSWFPYQMLCC